MADLRIRNWRKFQHYKQRNPPWIKLHIRMLNSRDFVALSPRSRCLLMELWVLASERDGTVTDDLDELRFRLRWDDLRQADLDPLISKRFLVICKQRLADACRETEAETEAETEEEAEQKPPASSLRSNGDGPESWSAGETAAIQSQLTRLQRQYGKTREWSRLETTIRNHVFGEGAPFSVVQNAFESVLEHKPDRPSAYLAKILRIEIPTFNYDKALSEQTHVGLGLTEFIKLAERKAAKK